MTALAVQQGHRSEIRVRADPVLAGLGFADHGDARVPVDVQGVRRVPRVVGEERLALAQRSAQQPQHLVRDRPHPCQIGLDDPAQRGRLGGRPAVGPEPEVVDLPIADRGVRADGPGLLQVRRCRRALRVAVGLRPFGQPAAAADADRVPLFDGGRQGEELPCRRAHLAALRGGDAVSGEQQEAGPLQGRVHRCGRGRLRGGIAGEPGAQVDRGDHSPMSSFQRSGWSRMKSDIIRTHV